MCGRSSQDLRFRLRRVADPTGRESYSKFLARTLEIGVTEGGDADDPWMSFAFVTGEGTYVANVDAAVLPLVRDGQSTATIGLRSVAVAPAWRGRGLFRDLLLRALAWGEPRGFGLAMLFTEEPSLYERFGFRSTPQHAFVGHAIGQATVRPARRLDLRASADRELIRTLVKQRAPVSSQCALMIDADQTLANLAKDDGYSTVLLGEPDTLVVYERADEMLVLADVISAHPPDLAAIIGTVGEGSRRLKILFPPDRLGWSGQTEIEDSGLMIRGEVPLSMRQPFIIPPTAEF